MKKREGGNMQVDFSREELIAMVNLIANVQIRGGDAITVARLIQKLQGYIKNVPVNQSKKADKKGETK